MNQSVVKALTLLEFFSEDVYELTLNELAIKSGMPKATTYRLLSTLESLGFLSKSKKSIHDVRYQLGLKLLEYGGLVLEHLEHRQTSLPHMKKLQSIINETVHLVILDGNEAVYIEKVESSHALRLYTRIGMRLGLSLGSGPQLLLAYLPKLKREELIGNMSFRKMAENTIMSKEDLYIKVENIRRNGFSISNGEQDNETIGISYPIHNYEGHMIAALCVSGPITRLFGEHLDFVHTITKKTAESISRDHGYIKSDFSKR